MAHEWNSGAKCGAKHDKFSIIKPKKTEKECFFDRTRNNFLAPRFGIFLPTTKYCNGNFSAQSYINTTGPIYVTSGAGGAPEPIKHPKTFHWDRANATAKILPYYGFAQLEIKNFTHGELSFYNTQNNSKIDPVNIVRLRH
jgi:hypothetical protein